MKQRRRDADDSGFTLIELIASMSISAIIIATLSTALISFYKNGAYTSRRDTHSAGKSLVAVYLHRDLSRAETPGPTTLSACTDLANDKLTLVWWDYGVASGTDPTPTRGSEHVAEYLLENDTTTVRPGVSAGLLKQLRRRTCMAGVAGIIDNQVLVRDLMSGDFASGGLAGTCAGGGTPVAATIRKYESDVTGADQVIRGCIDGRQR
jgi:prepilin-type N-terminal cleavage/methylation domain-containing protein